MSPAEYREWLRQRAVFDDAAFAEYVTVGGQVFPRHLREASRFADAPEGETSSKRLPTGRVKGQYSTRP